MELKPLINHTEVTKAIFDLVNDPDISAYFRFSDLEKSILQLRLQKNNSFRQIADALSMPIPGAKTVVAVQEALGRYGFALRSNKRVIAC